MRRFLFGASSIVLALGCAAGSDDDGGGGSGAGNTTTSTTGQGGSFNTTGAGGEGGFQGCASFTDEAVQQPAAMLIVLDKSASMTTNQKWATAQLAVVSAIDNDAFDSMSLGLVAFPASFTQPPECLCEFYCGAGCDVCGPLIGQVSCGVSALPQVAMAEAGTEKSNQGGVRKEIYDYLVSESPLSNQDDGSPIYDAMNFGYQALKAYDIEKRILVLITDGGFSCTSLSSRPGFSDGACNDWEHPDNVNQLITMNRDDAMKPVNTFIVGLPGSDSTGGMTGGYATPPYAMKLALSTYAVSGSPETVPLDCDQAATFTQGGAAPAVPCHLDLTTGPFDGQVLADAIKEIRGKALGCVYDLPEPPPGETINPEKVNVSLTLEQMTSTLPKRSDQNDTCETDGCWDYTDADTVELLGKACEDVTNATNAKVEIVVGCDTIVK
ncbi:MAG: hypothetical protein JNL21_41845 [Myxococcales bacterium]|nr:hypothetical protein [Myxococcales bacterium]